MEESVQQVINLLKETLTYYGDANKWEVVFNSLPLRLCSSAKHPTRTRGTPTYSRS